jgi:hypothetical protein
MFDMHLQRQLRPHLLRVTSYSPTSLIVASLLQYDLDSIWLD